MPVLSILQSFFSIRIATGVYKETGGTAQQAFPQIVTERSCARYSITCIQVKYQSFCLCLFKSPLTKAPWRRYSVFESNEKASTIQQHQEEMKVWVWVVFFGWVFFWFGCWIFFFGGGLWGKGENFLFCTNVAELTNRK